MNRKPFRSHFIWWSKRLGLVLYLLGLVGLAGWYAENYQFDRLLYLKSWFHGYYHELSWFGGRVLGSERLSLKIAGINSSGYRDREFYPKQEGEYLVLVVGDSNVLGTGVRNGQRFTRILERSLNKRRRTRVISVGKGGTNLLDHAGLASYYEEKLKPDAVIFVYFENDLLIHPWQDSEVAKLVEGRPKILDVTAQDSPEDYTRKVLGSYQEATANYQLLQIVVPQLPKRYLFFLLTYWPERESEREAEAVFRAAGITMVTPRQLYETHYQQLADKKNNKPEPLLTISEKEGHPNPLAHRMFAERLFEEITCNETYKFSSRCLSFDP